MLLSNSSQTYLDTLYKKSNFSSPCEMCTGTAILYKIPRIIVGENVNYKSPGEKWLLETRPQTEVHLLQNPDCIQMMKDFIETQPDVWQEDIHELQ
mgnify:FL=1